MKDNLFLQIMNFLASLADIIIDISLHIAGIYLFFWEKEYVQGSLVLGMATIYQVGCLYMIKLKEEME